MPTFWPCRKEDVYKRQLYDRRTTIGQIAEQKKHFAEEQVEYHDAPDEPVSVSELSLIHI